jgi:putative membrane protein
VSEQPSEDKVLSDADPQTVRTLLANDRTYLAWVRTSLSLVAGGVAVAKLLPALEVPGGRRAVGILLVGLGAAMLIFAFRQWRENDELIRAGRGIAKGRGLQLISVVASITVALGLVIALLNTAG